MRTTKRKKAIKFVSKIQNAFEKKATKKKKIEEKKTVIIQIKKHA